MEIIFKGVSRLSLRINQDDIDIALREYVLKKFPEYKEDYELSFPKIGNSDIITAEYNGVDY